MSKTWVLETDHFGPPGPAWKWTPKRGLYIRMNGGVEQTLTLPQRFDDRVPYFDLRGWREFDDGGIGEKDLSGEQLAQPSVPSSVSEPTG